MKRIRAVGLTVAVAAAVLVGVAPPASATPTSTQWQIDELGAPLEAVNIRGASMAALPSGAPVIYAPTFGEPARLSVLNGETGALLSSHEIGDKTTAIYTGVAPDGTAYVAGQTPGASLYSYDPASDVLTDLGAPVAGESNISRLTAFAADGTLYSGTFPHGHVFSYDPSTDAFHDFGAIAAGEQYARSMAFDGDSTLYVGTGTNARLFALDVVTEAKTEVLLPPAYAGTQSYINEMYFRDGLVFAFLSPAYVWVVYDTATGTWLPTIEDAQAVNVTEPVNGKVYFVKTDADLYSYRLQDGDIQRVTSTGQFSINSNRGLGILHLSDPQWPGATVTGMGLTGRMWHYNVQTGAFRWTWTQAVPGALKISALGGGVDGGVYASGYLTPGVMARIDAASDVMTKLNGPQQAEFIGTVPVVNGAERMYVGSYLDAGIWRQDPTQPWSYPTNPSRLARLDGYNQERILTIANASTRLAVGSLAKKGDPDGRLTLLNATTGAIDYTGVPVPGQSVVSLLFQRVGPQAVLIGGTTSHQLGVTPADPTARLFVFDLLTQSVVHVTVPRATADGISQIISLPDGRIWALTSDSAILELGITRHSATSFSIAVTEVVKIFGTARDAGNWNSPKLAVLDGTHVVGSAAGKVFTVDTTSGLVDIVGDGSHAAPSPLGDGSFFFADTTRVLHARPVP